MSGSYQEKNTYDAIVVGSGISGGWVTKELCDRGVKTLLLERGRQVAHVKDYPTTNLNPWDFKHRGAFTEDIKSENPIVDRCYAFEEATEHFFVKDNDHPYIQEKPFDWIRGYQEGGKSLIWARQTQRWSRYEFEAPARDGFAVPWPISYDDLAPWYSHVEKFAGISGNRDGIPHLPDSEVLPPFELNCVEKDIKRGIESDFDGRHVIIGRCAHLTEPQDIHIQQGRGKCQSRHLCYRGCPFGAYFSSNSSTLPWARRTGNLTQRYNSVVHSVIYDVKTGKASGVRVIDSETGQEEEYYARVIFVNGATLNTNLLLLNSTSSRFPNGLGNDSGTLGRYIAFHNYRGNMIAEFDGYPDKYDYGDRPTTAFMPSFRNVYEQETDFLRGYMVAFSAGRRSPIANGALEKGFGAGWKSKISDPGPWQVYMQMQGETIPKYENHVRLSDTEKDKWGVPLLVTSIDYDENDQKTLDDFLEQGKAMLEAGGCTNIRGWDTGQAPGLDIHEMGGVRMGADPQTSMLNEWNQLHHCNNVFVTDGACMTSIGNQNPSLTFMAISARAANHAADEMGKGNL